MAIQLTLILLNFVNLRLPEVVFMATSAHLSSNQKASAEQSATPASYDSEPGYSGESISIPQRAEKPFVASTPSNILMLQRVVGNKVTEQILNKTLRKSTSKSSPDRQRFHQDEPHSEASSDANKHGGVVPSNIPLQREGEKIDSSVEAPEGGAFLEWWKKIAKLEGSLADWKKKPA